MDVGPEIDPQEIVRPMDSDEMCENEGQSRKSLEKFANKIKPGHQGYVKSLWGVVGERRVFYILVPSILSLIR